MKSFLPPPSASTSNVTITLDHLPAPTVELFGARPPWNPVTSRVVCDTLYASEEGRLA